MKLKKNDAINLYIRKHSFAVRTIQKLMAWDTDKTLRDNCVFLRIRTTYGENFVQKYNLKFKSLRHGNGAKRTRKSEAYKILHDNNFTYEQIGEFFGITRQAVEDGIQRRK